MREERWTGPQRRKKQRLQQPLDADEGAQDTGEEDDNRALVGLEEKPVLMAAAGRIERWGTN